MSDGRRGLLATAFGAVAAAAVAALCVQAVSSDAGSPLAQPPSSTSPVADVRTTPPAPVSSAPAATASAATAPASTAPASAPVSATPRAPTAHTSTHPSTSSRSDPGAASRIAFARRTDFLRTAGCAATARYLVAEYLATHSCSGVIRWLETTTVAGRRVLVSVAVVEFGSAADASGFVALVSRDGTGDITPLTAAGLPAFVRYPSFLAATGPAGVAWVAEAMWLDGPTSTADPLLRPVVSAALHHR